MKPVENFFLLQKPPCGFPDFGIVYIVRGYAIYNNCIAYSVSVYAGEMRDDTFENAIAKLGNFWSALGGLSGLGHWFEQRRSGRIVEAHFVCA